MEKSSVRRWAKFFLAISFVVDGVVAAKILGFAAHTVLSTQIFWWVYIVITLAVSWFFLLYMIVKKEGVSTSVAEGLPAIGSTLAVAAMVLWVSLITLGGDLSATPSVFAVLGTIVFAAMLAMLYAGVRFFCYLTLDG